MRTPTHSFLGGFTKPDLEQETEDIPKISPRTCLALPKLRFYIPCPAVLVPTASVRFSSPAPSSGGLKVLCNLSPMRPPHACREGALPQITAQHTEWGATCSKLLNRSSGPKGPMCEGNSRGGGSQATRLSHPSAGLVSAAEQVLVVGTPCSHQEDAEVP